MIGGELPQIPMTSPNSLSAPQQGFPWRRAPDVSQPALADIGCTIR
jgi:hypothetical protein